MAPPEVALQIVSVAPLSTYDGSQWCLNFGHGEGSVYKETRTRQAKDGPIVVTLWVATVQDGRDPMTGTRRRVKVRAKTKAAAMEKVRAHQRRLDAGVRDEPKLTVGQFMAHWMAVVVMARVAHSMYLNYRNAVNLHIVPALGHYKLRDLSPSTSTGS